MNVLLQAIQSQNLIQGSAEQVTEKVLLKNYQKLQEYNPKYPGCENFKLPSADFSKYTLLGKYAEGSGCTTNFKKDVKDEQNKKILVYTVNVEEEGMCKPLRSSMNWILLPKLSSDYKVEFIVETTKISESVEN